MKKIVITGASGGLGSEVVRYFSSTDVKMLCTYSHKPGENFSNAEWIKWNSSDLLSLSELSEKIETFAPVDGWLHLTGGFWNGFQLEDTSIQKLKNMMEINLESFAVLLPVFVSVAEPDKHLSVVIMGAEAGLTPSAGMGAYGISKASLKYYMDVLTAETKGKPFSINMIVPSVIDTKANREAMPDSDFSTWVKPHDICSLINFLLTDSGKALKGSVLRLG